MKLRIALLAIGCAAALTAAWLLPRVNRAPDQFTVALRMIDSGQARDAVYLLEDPVWRGIAEYRAERYRRALIEFIQQESVLTLYNLGTAYAHVHEWHGAIAAFERTLRLDPNHADARHNLEVVKRAQQAEHELVEQMRNTRKLGRWHDGNRLTERSDDEDTEGGKAIQQDISEGEGQAADQEVAASGTSTSQGKLGDQARGDEGLAGNAPDDDPNAENQTDGQTASTGIVQMQESAQAAEILLNKITDNPARVLRARFRAIHKARQETGK
jgi:Ca-activated chloride channel family protein